MKEIISENNLLKIENGNFIFTQNDREFISLAVTERLLTIITEDIQDVQRGVDFENILFNIKTSSSDRIAELTRNIIDIDGVQRVNAIEIEQFQNNLKITLEIEYLNENVEININV